MNGTQTMNPQTAPVAQPQPSGAPGSREANAPGADNARGQQHTDAEGRISAPTIGSFLSAQDNSPVVNGMVLSHGRKDKTRITGLVLRKKKEFVDALLARWKEEGKTGEGFTRSAAVTAFNAYRRATTRDLSRVVGQRLIADEMSVDGVKVNKDGQVTGLTTVKASRAAQDKVALAEETIATSWGVPREALEKFRQEYRAKHPEIDIPATPEDESATDITATESKPETGQAGQGPQAVAAA